jgi:hypothetical protein
MSVEKQKLIAVLSAKMPNDIVTHLLDEYMHIKQQFFLRKFQPSELNAARFGECVLRLLEYLNMGSFTPFGTQIYSERIIKSVENNMRLPDTIRIFIPRLTRVILDVRNKRDVAHAGGEVNPNYSDALFVVHATDWILTEVVRHFHSCSIDEAQKIVNSINEVRVPIIAEVDGFVRVQDTSLDVRKKVLVILYYKRPAKVKDADLCKWSKYSNSSRFKAEVLPKLDQEELIHYEGGFCTLLPRGIGFVEKNISLDLLV